MFWIARAVKLPGTTVPRVQRIGSHHTVGFTFPINNWMRGPNYYWIWIGTTSFGLLDATKSRHFAL